MLNIFKYSLYMYTEAGFEEKFIIILLDLLDTFVVLFVVGSARC